MQTINLLAAAVRGREAFEVAAALRDKQFAGAPAPAGVVVSLAPCAKELFAGRKHVQRFENTVREHLIAA